MPKNYTITFMLLFYMVMSFTVFLRRLVCHIGALAE